MLPDREALKTHRSRVPSLLDPAEMVREVSVDVQGDDSEAEKDPLRQQFQKQRHLFSGKLPVNRTFSTGGVQPSDVAEKRREKIRAGISAGKCGKE